MWSITWSHNVLFLHVPLQIWGIQPVSHIKIRSEMWIKVWGLREARFVSVSLPRSPFEHFFLCTIHVLVSLVGGHRLPLAEGCCKISRTRVSVPLLKPHVFPFFMHGLQGPHSLASQCTETNEKPSAGLQAQARLSAKETRKETKKMAYILHTSKFLGEILHYQSWAR